MDTVQFHSKLPYCSLGDMNVMGPLKPVSLFPNNSHSQQQVVEKKQMGNWLTQVHVENVGGVYC